MNSFSEPSGGSPAPGCPRCGKISCACLPERGAAVVPPPLRQKEPVTLRLDRNGRKGKTVTLVEGLKMHPEGKVALLKKFQKLCGAGGALKAGTPEIQGDHRGRIRTELEVLGFRVRVI